MGSFGTEDVEGPNHLTCKAPIAGHYLSPSARRTHQEAIFVLAKPGVSVGIAVGRPRHSL